jgi:hypothetical protein
VSFFETQGAEILNQALYAHMNNKRKMKKKKGAEITGQPTGPTQGETGTLRESCAHSLHKVDQLNSNIRSSMGSW